MFRGIEIAASGMSSVINLNDIIANNLANVNTPGFKQLMPTFKDIHEVAVKAEKRFNADEDDRNSIGSLSLGSMLDTTQLDFSQGALQKTDGRLDVALNSDGFFVIQTKDGEQFYTRNGGFTLNEDGDLLTRAGDHVVGEGGRPISISIGTNSIKDITIMADGRITVKNEEVEKLMVVNFEDTSVLKMKGNTLFENSDKINNPPTEMENYLITQGYLETSNANIVKSMINSITGARTYETLSKVIRNTDATIRKAVNDVGRVR